MNKILNQLNLVPGVVGSMICSEDGHVLAHLFLPIFDAGMFQAVASIITDNAPAFQEVTGGVAMFDFRFDQGRIVIKPIHDKYLLLLCSNQVAVNFKLLDMAIGVASKHLEKTAAPLQERTVQASIVHAPTGPKPSPAELIEKGPLVASLSGMQAALAKFMGPMAKIIFIECVEKWLESHHPSKESLPELTKIINQEIDDREKSIQFLQMVIPYMK